jgi:hypothetical protein
LAKNQPSNRDELISSGTCSSISGVLDALLEALFKDFPGRQAVQEGMLSANPALKVLGH